MALITLLLVLFFNNQKIYSKEDKDKNLKQIEVNSDTENLEVVYTEDFKLKAKIYTEEMLEYPNLDYVYPKGLKIELYDKESKLSAVITASKVLYFNDLSLYHFIGNVKFTNAQKKEYMVTDELYWDRNTHKVYTESLVTIETEEMSITGKGLNSDEEFINYKILKPKGTLIKDKSEIRDKQ
jgi:LPS export ABC transporter protein LptC